jgi:hypothetical protein
MPQKRRGSSGSQGSEYTGLVILIIMLAGAFLLGSCYGRKEGYDAEPEVALYKPSGQPKNTVSNSISEYYMGGICPPTLDNPSGDCRLHKEDREHDAFNAPRNDIRDCDHLNNQPLERMACMRFSEQYERHSQLTNNRAPF